MIVYKNNEKDKENRVKFCIKVRKEIEEIYLLQMNPLSIFYHQENIDGLNQVIHMKGQKQITPKRFMFGSIQL